MGIKGLRELLKKEIGEYEETISMQQFAGKKILIDAPFFICVYKASRKELYREAFVNLIVKLLEHSIRPVFVFDGQSPKEKSLEKQKRNEKKCNQISRVERLERDLEKFKKERQLSDELREACDKASTATIVLKTKAITKAITYSQAKKCVEKLRNSILTITEEDFRNVKSLLDVFGIPWIVANGEAEIFCASLVKKGLADAVMTKDTDVLACRVPTMLYDVDLGNSEFTVIKIETILEKIGLNEKSWLDLCIMCGTDFNSNVPRVGPVKSLKYIREFETIDGLDGKLDVAILSHVKTRKIFEPECDLETLPDPEIPDLKVVAKFISDSKMKLSPTIICSKINMNYDS
jgi:5'-3' exonuclease